MASVAFASPAVKGLIRQRVGQVAALGMALGGLVLLVALGTYHAKDPSLNTATALAPSNAIGLAGSVTADVLLQFFGMAAGLPVVAMLAWAFRLAQGRPVRLGLRLVLLVGALPVVMVIVIDWAASSRRTSARTRTEACAATLTAAICEIGQPSRFELVEFNKATLPWTLLPVEIAAHCWKLVQPVSPVSKPEFETRCAGSVTTTAYTEVAESEY